MRSSKPMASANGAIMSAGVVVESTSRWPSARKAASRCGANGATISLNEATARRPAACTCSCCQPRATRAAARTRPMEKRFSPRRSLTA